MSITKYYSPPNQVIYYEKIFSFSFETDLKKTILYLPNIYVFKKSKPNDPLLHTHWRVHQEDAHPLA